MLVLFLQVPSIFCLTMAENGHTPQIPPDTLPNMSASFTSGIQPQAKVKPKVSYPQWKKVCECLNVGYPLDDLKEAQVPKSGQVLRHMAHFLNLNKGSGSAFSATNLAAKTVKRCWRGSNVAMASDRIIT